MRGNRFLHVLKVLVIVALAITIFGFVGMELWNHLMPAIFGLHTISYWQFIGLLLLSKILFCGVGRPGFGMHWRQRMMEKWEHMTPEEREKFRAGMRGRCGPFGPPPPEPGA